MSLLRHLRPTLLDRYVVREMVAPTGLGLVIFSFILLLQDITRLTGILVSRGADLTTVLRILENLMPSILAITIPMAFLLGVLLAFGRLASDSEIVALRASGVSPLRLLRAVLFFATVAFGATFYVMAEALPAANQQYRELLYSLVITRARTGMKPRVFTDDLVPGKVIYISDIPAETGEWKDVLIHDSQDPRKPRLILARRGRLTIDKEQENVELHLENGVVHSFEPPTPQEYAQQHFRTMDIPVPFELLFPKMPLAKGDREMTLGELSARVRQLRALGKGPRDTARYEVEWHKKFGIPGACIVFGLLGLGLSLGTKKEARSAAFALSIAIIFVYYVLIKLGEQAGDMGMIPPILAMWGANLVLGAAAIVLLVLNHREAAFDPLDPAHYAIWLPRVRRALSAPKRARPKGQVVVVIRMPRLDARVATILDRYIARAYVGHLTLVLAAFWAIFVLAHFMEMFDDIQQNHVKGGVVLHYYAFFTPAILHLMIPVGALITPLVTFGILSRRNEITAMKAGGISVYRAVLPVLSLGALASALLFVMGEFILPPTNRMAQADYNVIKGRPPQSSSFLERRWILGSDGRFYNYDYMTPGPTHEPAVFYGLSVYDVNRKSWSLRDRLYASRAAWNGVSYDLERGWRRSFGDRPSFRAFELVRTREIEPPAYFKREDREPDTLSFGELGAHIDSLETLGLDVVRLKVQLQRKVAFPLVSVVMTLIGVPFAFVVGRRGALYGIGISIVIAIVYWACLGIFENLGTSALLPPALAAWAPNILFGAAGFYLMLTLET